MWPVAARRLSLSTATRERLKDFGLKTAGGERVKVAAFCS
jgi:hypothetical protein